MRYEKPSMVAVASAMYAIRSGNCNQKVSAVHDSSACGSGSGHNTAGAYEADE